MTDEMTDVSVASQLITFIQYFDTDSETVETKFLSAQDVLINHDSANAQAIYDLLKAELHSSLLDIKKFTGLATDGAAVMVGTREGLAFKLRRDNPCMITIHCVCHRLALACTDSNEDTKYIQDVSNILRQTWQHFENSPKRMALLIKVLTNLNHLKVSSTKGKRMLAKKLKKACKTRWLSFDKSVEAMKQQYCGVLQTLQKLDSEYSDATAAGLVKKMKNAEFVGLLYILAKVLPTLSSVSLTFQRSNVNFSLIQPQLKAAKRRFNRIVEEETLMAKLQADVDSFEKTGDDVTFPPTAYEQMQSLVKKYVGALTQNLDQRFATSSEVISALSIFDAVSVPEYDADGFQEYGVAEVEKLAKHFFPN